MPSLAELIQQGAGHAWLFVPSAILLGVLHGLEPGHSKTMMAAFIIAIRGTVTQAVLLGLAATVSHTAVVWVIALGGLYVWQGFQAETLEPYLQIASAFIIIGIATWMMVQMSRERRRAEAAGHGHGHDHGHDHAHDEVRSVDTGHGVVAIEVFEQGVPPRWRVRAQSGQNWAPEQVTMQTERLDGAMQAFHFVQRDGFLESTEEIPEPHQFMARLTLNCEGHAHNYDLPFVEHSHEHDHIHEELRGLDVATAGYQDAHELAHANDIRRRFADQNVSTGQIVLFGLTGGLIPCPAAVTVLLLCLQLKEIPLGAVLVLCFSIGLAITLVTVGAAAALSVKHVSMRWSGFQTLSRRAPYFSSILIIMVGLYVGIQGVIGLHLI